MASLQTAFDIIDKMLTNQFGAIKKEFGKSLNIPRHNQRTDPIYKEISCRVSLYALKLIEEELDWAAEVEPQPSCCCSIRTTHGLPCRHILRYLRNQDQVIPLSCIHRHWTRLSMRADEFNHAGDTHDRETQFNNALRGMEPEI